VGAALSTAALPHWAAWRPSAAWTVGVEEEVMLLDPATGALAQRADEVLAELPAGLARHATPETHRAAIELSTDPFARADEAAAQLASLRRRLAAALHPAGLCAATAGLHPTATWQETEVMPALRQQVIHETMGELARREPTFALHVHVGVPDPEAAIELANRLRVHVPLLLALSASSPFWQGRDARLASARTVVFGGFPRTGLPRAFAGYADWVGVVDGLVRSGALPEPSFVWWDVRPQPSLGTIELRVMDAQPTVARTAALVALVQALARLELEEGWSPPQAIAAAEVLAENRFLAARDGIDAELIDVVQARLRPAREVLAEVLAAARPHADALGCRSALEDVALLADLPEPATHRAIGATALPFALASRFLEDVTD
jgi:carboxylate-amine ligase